jgi:hypothetical protein
MRKQISTYGWQFGVNKHAKGDKSPGARAFRLHQPLLGLAMF